MTKKVRVENADNSSYKLVVQTWQKSEDGDKLISEKELNHAADISEFYIHSTQYLIVKEL